MAPKKKARKKVATKKAAPKKYPKPVYNKHLDGSNPTDSRFVKWIDEVGASKIAKELNVSRFTVYTWRRHYNGEGNGNRPSPDLLIPILKLAGGKLVTVDIFPARTT